MITTKNITLNLLSLVDNAISKLSLHPAIPICNTYRRPDKPFTIGKYKDVYYPTETGYTKGEMFIEGQGYVKLPKTLITVEPLPAENWYQSLIDIYNKYGFEVAKFAITQDLSSIGNRYTFFNLANAVQVPGYFDWITELHNLEMEFLRMVMLSYSVLISGEPCNEWHQTINNADGKYMCKFRNTIRFVKFIDDDLMGLMRITPMFDPIAYEPNLNTFIYNFVPGFDWDNETDWEKISNMSVKNKMVLIAGDTKEANELVSKIQTILFKK
jgi:hypothetical protein